MFRAAFHAKISYVGKVYPFGKELGVWVHLQGSIQGDATIHARSPLCSLRNVP